MELQVEVSLVAQSSITPGWAAVPVVSEVSEQEASENQRLAAEIGIAPSQVQHMRALGLLTIPPVPEPRGPGA